MSSIRVDFYSEDVKINIYSLARDVDMKVNQLVNLILSSQFSEKDRKALQLLKDLQVLKQNYS